MNVRKALLIGLLPVAFAQETGGAQTGGSQEVYNISTVSETFGLFTMGLGQASAQAAVQNIQGWQARLEATGDEQLVSLSGDLGSLAEALQAASPDSAAIAEQLVGLGEQTDEIASNVDDEDLARRLSTLSYVLQEVGQTVQQQPQADLSNVIPVVPPVLGRTAQFLQGDLANASLAAALLNIEAWQGRILTNVEGDAAEQLVEDLEELQNALQAEQPDQAQLGELFSSLAESTRGVAEEVDPALQDALEGFAGVLESAGQQNAGQ